VPNHVKDRWRTSITVSTPRHLMQPDFAKCSLSCSRCGRIDRFQTENPKKKILALMIFR